MDSDHHLHHHNHHHHQYSNDNQQHQQQQQQQPVSSGLMRYRSAPSSYFASLINNTVGDGGENCDEFLNPRHSSPETERIFSRLISSGGTGDFSSSHSLRDVRRNASVNEALISQFPEQSSNYSSGSQMVYQNQAQPSLANQNSAASSSVVDISYGVVSSTPMDHSPQMKIGIGGSNSNLIRQSSSPAGFFSHINIENGYVVMRGMGNLGSGNGTNAEASFPSPSRLKSQMDFSSGPPSSLGRMTPIIENRSKSMEITGFPIGSWDDSAIISDTFLKTVEEDDDRKAFFAMNNASENQIAEDGNRPPPTVLSHHLSLPTSSAELSAMEKLLQFQDSVPCKIRAKRGFATHPRSIAERVRRTRISERMRKLQELVPNMDKQTNTADMLDLAVDYIKDLQSQVQTLSNTRAKCTCSNRLRE